MITDEWNALLNQLTEVLEYIVNTIQKAADALAKVFEKINKEEKGEVKKNIPFTPHCKKNRYIKNYTPIYRIERKIRKNLPYQRRNY